LAVKVRRLAWVLGGIAALLLPVLALLVILQGFSFAASWTVRERGLSREDHNAIKHAYAAAEIYSLLRLIAGPECAASIVTDFGEANEWAERYVKHTTDWSPEVYKDLRNNQSGIAAAEWLYGQAGYTGPFTRARLIGKLAEDGDLALIYTDPRIPELPLAPDTETAIARMHGDQAALRARIADEIAAKGAALKSDLGLN
jgi:hypothetical protein